MLVSVYFPSNMLVRCLKLTLQLGTTGWTQCKIRFVQYVTLITLEGINKIDLTGVICLQ